MAPWKKAGDGRLEEKADAFLKASSTPPPSRRLAEYGLQRIYAQAQAGERARTRALERKRYRNPALLRRAALVMLALLVFMVLGAGGAYALSYGAQPDSALYGAKIFFERARVALNASASGDARLEMGFCDRRIKELEGMYEKGGGAGADRWLREYRRNLAGIRSSVDSLPQEEMDALYLAYQEALQRHSGAMQRMRGGGSPTGLEGSIEEACRACEMEREWVRMRRGHGRGNGPQGYGNEAGGTPDGAPAGGGSSHDGAQAGGGAGEGPQEGEGPQPECGPQSLEERNGAESTQRGDTSPAQDCDPSAQGPQTSAGEGACYTQGGDAAGAESSTTSLNRRLCP